MIWRTLTGSLAAALMATIAFLGIHAATTHPATVAQVSTQNTYLGELATFANYLARTNAALCLHDHVQCPPVPSFPDPPGLPALGGKAVTGPLTGTQGAR